MLLPATAFLPRFAVKLLPPPVFQTTSLNKHLQDLMDGLTAKVFRTYNASITLQEQLDALTNGKGAGHNGARR